MKINLFLKTQLISNQIILKKNELIYHNKHYIEFSKLRIPLIKTKHQNSLKYGNLDGSTTLFSNESHQIYEHNNQISHS